MTTTAPDARLRDVAPHLESILLRRVEAAASCDASEIRRETVYVETRDGTRLATDLYLPPRLPAPAVAMRTPYGRTLLAATFTWFAQRGFAVVSQDCRGTGDSEPGFWDFALHEEQDGRDFVDWLIRQDWYGGFVGSLGGSYVGWTQWCMALHPAMSAVAPEVCALGVFPTRPPRLYTFVNSYSRSVGNDAEHASVGYEEMERLMHEETLAGGFYNEPLYMQLPDALLARIPALGSVSPAAARRLLWEHYRTLAPGERVDLIKLALGTGRVTFETMGRLSEMLGHNVPRHAYSMSKSGIELFESIHAPALVITAWYDWGLGDTLASWDLLIRHARGDVRSRSSLLIAPTAHNMPGYREGIDHHPELERAYRTADIRELLRHWYEAVRADALDDWPAVVYYLMGANEWRASEAWPPPAARTRALYLGPGGALSDEAPASACEPDRYVYDPSDPTPTVGGSVVSYVYTPGSVDVQHVQRRPDVLTYTTNPLSEDLDVVGPLRLVLYASSSAVDTDFSARLTDVFPDGRAVQLQSTMLRTRYRNRGGDMELLEPGRVYRLEIDMWATANRFRAGHRLRLDVASADFPKFDRHTNRAGGPGPPIPAEQTVYHDAERPSHLQISVLS